MKAPRPLVVLRRVQNIRPGAARAVVIACALACSSESTPTGDGAAPGVDPPPGGVAGAPMSSSGGSSNSGGGSATPEGVPENVPIGGGDFDYYRSTFWLYIMQRAWPFGLPMATRSPTMAPVA